MSLQFPSDPALVNNIYDAPNGVTYYYDGTKWSGHLASTNEGFQDSAQDAVSLLFANGIQTGITVSYNDTANSMDLVVTDQDWSQIQNKPSIPADVTDLTDTTNLIPPYYVLPVATNQSIGGISVGHNLLISSGGELSTEPYILASESPVYVVNNVVDLDLTKQVFILGIGTWRLADGIEGQICYFTMQTNGNVNSSMVIVNNARVIRNDIAEALVDATWLPFNNVAGSQVDAGSTVTAIFTEGAWNVSQGIINP